MAITKTKLSDGKVSWGYYFSVGPRGNRRQYKKEGYRTRDDATNAEAKARLGAAAEAKPTANPKTLSEVIVSFIADQRDKLSPKTIARYEEMRPYISAELLA